MSSHFARLKEELTRELEAQKKVLAALYRTLILSILVVASCNPPSHMQRPVEDKNGYPIEAVSSGPAHSGRSTPDHLDLGPRRGPSLTTIQGETKPSVRPSVVGQELANTPDVPRATEVLILQSAFYWETLQDSVVCSAGIFSSP